MIVCTGEILIDFVSTKSGVDLAGAPGFVKAAGGAPANVAAGIAKLGTPSAFIGMVGEDGFGDFLEKTLRDCGVDTSGLQRTREAGTTLAFVSVRKDGERRFAFYRNPGADMLLSMSDVDTSLLDRASIFHFGSVSLTCEPARRATIDCAQLAREKGLLVSFDPNFRPPLWDDLAQAKKEIIAAIPLADFLKISEEELAFLTGKGDPATGCQVLEALGPSLILVTLGERGCYYHHDEEAGTVPGFRVKTVDTTGAGDGFVAGFLHRLHETGAQGARIAEGLPEALRFANAAGALTTTGRGAIPSLPDAKSVEALLRRSS